MLGGLDQTETHKRVIVHRLSWSGGKYYLTNKKYETGKNEIIRKMAFEVRPNVNIFAQMVWFDSTFGQHIGSSAQFYFS